MSASFSGSSSLPSSVVGESLNWYSDQESLYLRPRDGDQSAAFFRVVKSHLDSPGSVGGGGRADGGRRRRRRGSVGDGGADGASAAATRAPAKRLVVRLPPIVLHSPGGKELDTDTAYQQSIRESKARSQLGLPPMDSSEWRLPHAAVPARPDFSRRVPSLPGGAARRDARRGHASPSSLTAENISRLQDALAKRSTTERLLSIGSTPSDYSAYGTELQWLSAGLRRIYVPFIESAPLHDKTCSPADKRTSDYEFPGWCYGCRLQNGAHWHGDPSYDPLRDRPVRVGGGFAYVTRDLFQNLGDWTAAMRHAVPGLISKDASWDRSRLLGAVDDAVIQALADHQAVIQDRYPRLPDIARLIEEERPAAGARESAAAEQHDNPLSIVSVSAIGSERRRSVGSDGASMRDTSESIDGSAESAGPPAPTAAKRKSKKTSTKRRPLQDLAIGPLQKHISVIREQTELSVHQDSVPTTTQPPPDGATAAIADPPPPPLPALSHPLPPAARLAVAAATPSPPPHPPPPATRPPAVEVERSVIVPRPAARRPSLEPGSAEKYTVRIKLLSGDDSSDGGRRAHPDGPAPAADGASAAGYPSGPSNAVPEGAAAAADEQPPVDLDMIFPDLIEDGADALPPSESASATSDATVGGERSPMERRPGDGTSSATNVVGDATEPLADVAGGDQLQQQTRGQPSAKGSAKSHADAGDGLQRTLKHALQISTWQDPQAVAAHAISASSELDAVLPAQELPPTPAPPTDARTVPSAKATATNSKAAPGQRGEEVVVQRIGKRQNVTKRTINVRPSKKPHLPEPEKARPSAQEAPEERPDQASPPSAAHRLPPAPLSEHDVVLAAEPEASPPVADGAQAVPTSDQEPADISTDQLAIPGQETLAEVDNQQETVEVTSASPVAGDAGLLEATASEPGSAHDSRTNGSEQDGGSISREPSVVKSTPPRRRVILSARPAKKPNFMHLLTLNSSTEIEEIPASPPRSPTPDLDFDIERESPVELPSPSPPSTVKSQPLPPIRYAMTPSPVPQRIVVREPTPEPEEEAPEPIIVRQRPRKSLDAFLHSRRGVPPSKRPEVIQPLTKKELKEIVDPLDYLSRYCLIRLDRLPYYEKVFREVVSYQRPRFPPAEAATTATTTTGQDAQAAAPEAGAPGPRPTLDAASAQTGRPPPLPLANAEKLLSSDRATASSADKTPTARPPLNYRLLRSFAQLMSVPEFDEPAINIGEFHVQRITFAIRKQYERYDKLVQTAELLEALRDRAVADMAKQKYAEVLHPSAASVEKDAQAKKAKGKPEKASGRTAAPAATKPPKLSDSEVLHRLPSPLMDELLEDAAVRSMSIKLSRLEERIAAAELRMTELEEEKHEMELWAQEVYEAERSPPDPFAGNSSDDTNILGHLCPSEDNEMNLEELEYALRLVNNQLITQRELMYVYHILKIPGRQRINLKTFCCVSALSEKVQELDPVVRTLINAFDYDALEMKMEVCKELFYMLADKSADAIDGAISIRTLAAELIAGGISRENLNYIIHKLDFRRKGYIEYLDFLVYIPLFIEIHRRIVANPLSDHRASYERSQSLHAQQQQQSL